MIVPATSGGLFITALEGQRRTGVADAPDATEGRAAVPWWRPALPAVAQLDVGAGGRAVRGEGVGVDAADQAHRVPALAGGAVALGSEGERHGGWYGLGLLSRVALERARGNPRPS